MLKKITGQKSVCESYLSTKENPLKYAIFLINCICRLMNRLSKMSKLVARDCIVIVIVATKLIEDQCSIKLITIFLNLKIKE